jgi:hypothetical protein
VSIKIWLRAHDTQWLNWGENLLSSRRLPIHGVWIHHSYISQDFARFDRAIELAKKIPNLAWKPGIILHIGAGEPDVHQKWKNWLRPDEWKLRAEFLALVMRRGDTPSQDFPIDAEVYDSKGDESPGHPFILEMVEASQPFANVLQRLDPIVYPGFVQYSQDAVFATPGSNITMGGEESFGLVENFMTNRPVFDRKVGELLRLAAQWKLMGRNYIPVMDGDICRDWAAPIRDELYMRGIKEVWAFVDQGYPDSVHFGTKAWIEDDFATRVPPDPAALGTVFFDLEPGKPLQAPRLKVADQSLWSMPLAQATERGNLAWLFDQTPRCWMRLAFDRQMSKEWTLFVVGTAPSVKANNNTGWQLGASRVYTAFNVPAGLRWGNHAIAHDDARAVWAFVNKATTQEVWRDGVFIGSKPVLTAAPELPPTEITVGSHSGLKAVYPGKGTIERMIAYEGIPSGSIPAVMFSLCETYGIRNKAPA